MLKKKSLHRWWRWTFNQNVVNSKKKVPTTCLDIKLNQWNGKKKIVELKPLIKQKLKQLQMLLRDYKINLMIILPNTKSRISSTNKKFSSSPNQKKKINVIQKKESKNLKLKSPFSKAKTSTKNQQLTITINKQCITQKANNWKRLVI